jgi:ribosomal protein S3
VIGVKVWIFKGEVFDVAPEAAEEPAAEGAAPAAEQTATA